MIECSWKSTFGIDCMTCGFQRSIKLLFEGNVVDSFFMFPATIPLIITFILLFVHLYFKLKKGAQYILYTFSFSAALILINFSVKLVTGDVFH